MTRVQELEGQIAERKIKLEALRKQVADAKRVRTAEEKTEWSTLTSEIEDFEDQLKDANAEVARKAKEVDEKGIKVSGSGEPKKAPKKPEAKSFETQVEEGLEKLQKSIASPLSEQNEVFVSTRANVAAGSVTNNTDALRVDSIGQLAHRKLKLYDMFQKIPVGKNANGVIRYTDWTEGTKVRAAAMIAEGAAFPESTAAWQEYTLDLKKVGDTIPITEESLHDRERFTAELRSFLTTNVDLIVDQQLYNGDGTGNNLTGLYQSAGTYAAAAAGITDASIYDLAVKVRTSIETGLDSKYQANVAIMNRADIDKMKLKKDGNNNYVMPPFVDENGNKVDGMLVIESNTVTANTMLVGDSRFGKIYEIPGIFVGTGLVNDQYTKDLITMKARRRLGLLVRTADQGAWKKVTSISAALVTLAT